MNKLFFFLLSSFFFSKNQNKQPKKLSKDNENPQTCKNPHTKNLACERDRQRALEAHTYTIYSAKQMQ